MQTKRVRVPGTQFKQGVMFSYPINDEACAAIARAQERYRHPRLVFHFRGQKLINPNGKSWAKAVRECGLVPGKVHGLEEGRQLRWHDLRHTWATWHVMAGTPVHVLKELGGWSTATVVERIADLERQLAEAHRRLDWVVDNQGEGGLFDMSRPYVCIRFPVLGRGKERFWCEPKGERLLAAIDREGSEG